MADGETRLKRLALFAGALLSANAGFINAAFLVALFNPVSHVTGSLSNVGASVRAGEAQGIGDLVMILTAFFAGAMAAGAMLRRPVATGRRYGAALVIQSVFLAVAPVLVAEEFVGLGAAMGAAATGLQNGMSSNYRGVALRTSHMTGTMTDLGVFVGRKGYRAADRWKGGLLATTLAMFVLGGALGGVWASFDGIYALWAPAVCCAALGLVYVLYRHRQHVNLASGETGSPSYSGHESRSGGHGAGSRSDRDRSDDDRDDDTGDVRAGSTA